MAEATSLLESWTPILQKKHEITSSAEAEAALTTLAPCLEIIVEYKGRAVKDDATLEQEMKDLEVLLNAATAVLSDDVAREKYKEDVLAKVEQHQSLFDETKSGLIAVILLFDPQSTIEVLNEARKTLTRLKIQVQDVKKRAIELFQAQYQSAYSMWMFPRARIEYDQMETEITTLLTQAETLEVSAAGHSEAVHETKIAPIREWKAKLAIKVKLTRSADVLEEMKNLQPASDFIETCKRETREEDVILLQELHELEELLKSTKINLKDRWLCSRPRTTCYQRSSKTS